MINFNNKFLYNFFFFCSVLLVSCQNTDILLSDWQDQINKQDPQLSNILVKSKTDICLSLNFRKDGYYALYYKDMNKHSSTNYISYWIETHYKDTKQLLNAGYSVNTGVYGLYFKQSKKFDSIHFCYKISGEKVNKIILYLSQTKEWMLE